MIVGTNLSERSSSKILITILWPGFFHEHVATFGGGYLAISQQTLTKGNVTVLCQGYPYEPTRLNSYKDFNNEIIISYYIYNYNLSLRIYWTDSPTQFTVHPLAK